MEVVSFVFFLCSVRQGDNGKSTNMAGNLVGKDDRHDTEDTPDRSFTAKNLWGTGISSRIGSGDGLLWGQECTVKQSICAGSVELKRLCK